MRRLGRGPGTFAVLFALFLGGCELAGLWDRPIPVVTFAGNVAFGLLLVTALLVELSMLRRGRVVADGRFALAAAGTMALAFAIWNLANTVWCDPRSPVQGHAAWHLLGAVAAYLLFRYYASERTVDADRVAATPVARPAG
jgi:hypothetical protein